VGGAAAAGGAIALTVRGSGFAAGRALGCAFGGAPPTPARRVDDGTLVCSVPARGAPGAVRLAVVALDGSSSSAGGEYAGAAAADGDEGVPLGGAAAPAPFLFVPDEAVTGIRPPRALW
jgi:hypothetical protein